MKIITVIGARPQFVKAGTVSRELSKEKKINELILHTGQHYDRNMSDIFIDDLNLPKPTWSLDIRNGSHAQQVGRMLVSIEDILKEEKPDYVLVYGDTNSTLAGALSAVKLHIPIVHIEAGLRSFNRKMPEEINRLLTDQMSSVLFCPTDRAVDNLISEGFDKRNVTVSKVGDVMQDAALLYSEFSKLPISLEQLNLESFILATVHRAENTNFKHKLFQIVSELNHIHEHISPVLIPLHPRTKRILEEYNIRLNAHIIEPVSYLEMLALLKQCSLVMTDSGGLQKEAFFFNKYCITLREETEWQELVDLGVNVLMETDCHNIETQVNAKIGKKLEDNFELYGGGKASQKIKKYFISQLSS